MFSAFRPKPTKQPTPTVEILGFDGETLELQSSVVLVNGPQTVILLHSELEIEKECQVNVDQGFPDKQMYWASLAADNDVAPLLQSLIPKEVEYLNKSEEEDAAPTWDEKRSKVRLQRIIGIMSPQVDGFRCVTHDIHGDGLRLQLDKAVEAGRSLKVRFELEDHRLAPFDLIGDVLWCQENPLKGYWAGLRFSNISDKQRESIDKFVEQVLSYESGVLTRDYTGD